MSLPSLIAETLDANHYLPHGASLPACLLACHRPKWEVQPQPASADNLPALCPPSPALSPTPPHTLTPPPPPLPAPAPSYMSGTTFMEGLSNKYASPVEVGISGSLHDHTSESL